MIRPPHPAEMRKALLRDPFWVAPSEVDNLTDKQMWEWYVRPALEAAERQDDAEAGRPSRSPVRDDDPDGTVRDERGRVVPPEAFLMALAAAGSADPAQVSEAIRKAHARRKGTEG